MAEKRVAVWGTGNIGKKYTNKTYAPLFAIKAFCDSNPVKCGNHVNGISVISPEELYSRCNNGAIDYIVIAIADKEEQKRIREGVLLNCCKDIAEYSYDGFMSVYQEAYDSFLEEQLALNWNVDFAKQAENWLDNLDSEINYWLNTVAKGGNEQYHADYIRRSNNESFYQLDANVLQLENELKDGNTVLDLGSGLLTKYGSKINDGTVEVVAADPLAYFYNQINEKYLGRSDVCKFGLFEFIANFDYAMGADAIIINNALDHCIDPLKSIIECLYVLRTGGILHVRHRRAEALFEDWQGLHKWNVDCDKSGDLVFWNKQNGINVTKYLNDLVEIDLHYSNNWDRENDFIVADIHKLRDFSLRDYINYEDEGRLLDNM